LEKGELQEAIASYRQAIAIAPNTVDAHWNLSQLLLLLGDYEQGWREYEWRWQRKNFPTMWRALPQPRWTGQDLAGKTLLVHTEQGYGDAIQFVRYVPMLAARSARVVVLCQPRMARLLQSVDGIHQIVPGIESPSELPPFDFHCPMMSLPFLFGNAARFGPGEHPLPEAQPVPRATLAREGQRRLPDDLSPESERSQSGPGLGRQFRPYQRHAPLRHASASRPARQHRRDVLQPAKRPGCSQAAAPPQGMELIDLTEGLGTLPDTAALVSCLDLVITVDTAVAHLAGAWRTGVGADCQGRT